MGKQLMVAIGLAGLVTVVLLLLTRSAPKQTVQDIPAAREQLVQAWKLTRSVRAKMEMRAEGPAPALQRGTYEMKAEGDKRLVRVELTLMNPMGITAGESARLTSISDGQFTYVLNEQGGQAMARKSPVDPSMHMDPVAFFSEMEQHGEMERLPDETWDGRAVTVIRVIPKGATLAEGYVVYYLAKDSGLIVRMIATEPSSGMTTHAGLSEVVLNEDIPSDRFVFRPPPGVEVQDMSTAP